MISLMDLFPKYQVKFSFFSFSLTIVMWECDENTSPRYERYAVIQSVTVTAKLLGGFDKRRKRHTHIYIVADRSLLKRK